MTATTANGITFAVKDLIGVATSFDALGLTGRIPIKFGHNGEQPLTDGQPALGWVSRIYVEGDTLYGDFTDMPTSVYELIRSGAYKFVSVELLRDVQAGTRKLPWVLDAVALLGADQPAFGTLADLQSLTMKRKPAFQARARVERRQAFSFISEARKGMEDKDVQAAIAAAVEATEKKLTTAFTAQIEKVKTDAQASADAQVAKAKAEAHRAQIKAKFETAVQAEALLPAKRESFYKFNRVDDDKSVTEIKLEDVDAYIEEFSDKAKLAASRGTQTKAGEKVEHAATYALEVTRRAEEVAVKRGGKANDPDALHEATKIVLSADKKLATAYFADPSGAFKAEAA
jgi:hypothetical protein